MDNKTSTPPLENSLPQIVSTLVEKLEQRPTRKELEERHILLDTDVEPVLQAKEVELRRSRLENSLSLLLEKRQAHEEYERQLVKAHLELNLSKRSTQEELVSHNILKNTKVAPALQAKQLELERSVLENNLECMLANRPTLEEFERSLVRGNIERLLNKRPTREELVNRNVLKDTPEDFTELLTLEDWVNKRLLNSLSKSFHKYPTTGEIGCNLTRTRLEQLLEKRPTREELISRNILIDIPDEPAQPLTSAELECKQFFDSMKKLLAEFSIAEKTDRDLVRIRIDQMLDNHPTYDEIIKRHVMENTTFASTLQAKQSEVDFKRFLDSINK
ncbi:hypothetical protein FBU31_000946 [Coemansia sp. 'formosensis']|nr:hypothetical protein FBU31_000946 [Coemansia sp. 'formosensis']